MVSPTFDPNVHPEPEIDRSLSPKRPVTDTEYVVVGTVVEVVDVEVVDVEVVDVEVEVVDGADVVVVEGGTVVVEDVVVEVVDEVVVPVSGTVVVFAMIVVALSRVVCVTCCTQSSPDAIALWFVVTRNAPRRAIATMTRLRSACGNLHTTAPVKTEMKPRLKSESPAPVSGRVQ